MCSSTTIGCLIIGKTKQPGVLSWSQARDEFQGNLIGSFKKKGHLIWTSNSRTLLTRTPTRRPPPYRNSYLYYRSLGQLSVTVFASSKPRPCGQTPSHQQKHASGKFQQSGPQNRSKYNLILIIGTPKMKQPSVLGMFLTLSLIKTPRRRIP